MTPLRVLLWTLSLTLLLTLSSGYEPPRTRRNQGGNFPAPLHLFPGPYPPSNSQHPPRKQINRQASPPHHHQFRPAFRPIPNSKPPPFQKYPGRPFGAPSKPKKPNFPPKGPQGFSPNKKHPYYGQPHGLVTSFNRPTPYPKPFHTDNKGVPKQTVAKFVNKPKQTQQGTPKLTYKGNNRNPTISYGPPYPPKPFKSYGVPSSGEEEDYNEEDSSQQVDTAVKYNGNNGFNFNTNAFKVSNQQAFVNPSTFGSSVSYGNQGGTAYGNDGTQATFNQPTYGTQTQNFGSQGIPSFNFGNLQTTQQAGATLTFGNQDAGTTFNFGNAGGATYGNAGATFGNAGTTFGNAGATFGNAGATYGTEGFGSQVGASYSFGNTAGTVDHVGGFSGYGGQQAGNLNLAAGSLNFPEASSTHLSVAHPSPASTELQTKKSRRRRPQRQEDASAVQVSPVTPATMHVNFPNNDKPREIHDWGDFLMETFTPTPSHDESPSTSAPRHRKIPSRARKTSRPPTRQYQVSEEAEESAGAAWLPSGSKEMKDTPWQRSTNP